MVWESPVEDGQGRSGPGFGHRPCLSSGRAMARRSHRSEYAAEWKDAFCLCAAFCANAGFSRLRRFTLGFSRLRRFTQGKWIRVKRQHVARARARSVCVCASGMRMRVYVCVTGACDGELGRSPAFSLHPGLACVACLGTGGRACGSSECRAGRSPVSGLH